MAYFSLLAGRTKFLSMKKFYSLLFFVFLIAVSHAQGDKAGGGYVYASVKHDGGGMDEVINALRNGNATELAKFVDDNIEISLPSKSDSYSRSQALTILQDFFANSGVKGFDVKFRGDNGGTQYCIGTLQTGAGNFRTTFFLANRSGKQLVKEIRFQTM